MIAQPTTDINRLQIPRLNLEVQILKSNTAEALNKGAWHRWPERGNPLKGGNFILSGHRFVMGLTPQQTQAKSPFYHIDLLRTGDDIYVDWQGERYVYKIEASFAVKPTQTEIEAPTKDAKLTLYSCTLGGTNDGRQVVIARIQK